MAEVIVVYKVMPASADVDMDRLEEKIKSTVNPERIEREPIAFGLVAINVTKFVADAEGKLKEVENKIKSIKDVGEIEITKISRSL